MESAQATKLDLVDGSDSKLFSFPIEFDLGSIFKMRWLLAESFDNVTRKLSCPSRFDR